MAFIKLGGRTATGAQKSGGIDLAALYLVDNVSRPIAPMGAAFSESQGTSDAVLVSAAEKRPTISMSIYIPDDGPVAARSRLRTLASQLTFREPRSLEFEDDGGLFYMVVPSGARAVEVSQAGIRVDARFEATAPWLFSEGKAFEVSAATQLEFGGTASTPLSLPYQTITADANGEWGLQWRDEANAWHQFVLSGLTPSASTPIQLDAQTGICRAGSGLHYAGAGSRWPMTKTDGSVYLTPYKGSSTFVASAVPRWV